MKPVSQLLVLVSLTCVVFGQEDSCNTPNDDDGTCVYIIECEILKNLIKGSAVERERLKQWHCGFENHIPKVCCPIKTLTTTTTPTTTTTEQITTTTTITTAPRKKCVTLEGTVGACVKLNNCPKIAARLKDPTEINLEYIQRSRCLGTVKYSVCCDKPIDGLQIAKKPGSSERFSNNACPPSTKLPDPNSDCCGIESAGGNKIIGGSPTNIDEYPWLVLIEYTRDYLCGGTLISGQHVITAAHCVVTDDYKSRGEKSVRLGEYNTTNVGPDCVEVPGGGFDCTFGAISIAINQTIVHPEYNTDKKIVYSNDIAILKLNEMAPYNEFIRPICLPTLDTTKSPPVKFRFFVAGWGVVSERQGRSDIKLHIDLPYVDMERCKNVFVRNNVPIVWEKQICAGGEFNKDSCKGDSGGPLMYLNDKRFEVLGITSYGIVQCGNEDTPSIYTKIYEYIPWIKTVVG